MTISDSANEQVMVHGICTECDKPTWNNGWLIIHLDARHDDTCPATSKRWYCNFDGISVDPNTACRFCGKRRGPDRFRYHS